MRTKYKRDFRIAVGDHFFNVHNIPLKFAHDIYQLFMTISWPIFYLANASIFFIINIIFGLLYKIDPNAISHQNPSNFWGDFFFSIETLSTLGYGDMHPQTLYGHTICMIEIFIGMMCVALATGVTFSRFSLPKSRIAFSENPVVGSFNNQKALMIRAANARQSVIVDASAELFLLESIVNAEGEHTIEMKKLHLETDRHPMFLLSWTLIHVINEQSPLYGYNQDTLAQKGTAILIAISGIDATTYQTMNSRSFYNPQKIRWNYQYENLLSQDANGEYHIDFNFLNKSFPSKTFNLGTTKQ